MTPVVELIGRDPQSLEPVERELPTHGLDCKFLQIGNIVYFFDPIVLHLHALEQLSPDKTWKNAGAIKFTEDGIYVYSGSTSLKYNGDSEKHRLTLDQIKQDFPGLEVGSMNYFSVIGEEQYFGPTV